MRLLLIRLRIFYTVDTGGGNRTRADDTHTTEAEGGWVGGWVRRKRPHDKIRRSTIRFGGHVYESIIEKEREGENVKE